jgi:acyl-CoA thioester hydrolase
MYQHEVQVRVRYSETDKMGFVYYGNYGAYYEVARVEAFRAIGFSYKKMEDEGIGMPVLSMNIKYHGPAVRELSFFMR